MSTADKHSIFRFAPSPNGRLHLGHAFSALTAFDAARSAGGRFLLRIEDIDLGRARETHVQAILEDLAERPFITIGFLALLLLIALAVTSTDGMRRRLGRRWQTLHNAVYVIAALGVWHYWWQVKKDITEPLIYAVILAMLLAPRAWWYWQRRQSRNARVPV